MILPARNANDLEEIPPPIRAQMRFELVERFEQHQRDLAARMGIKDPQKARENFRKRRESGVSQIGAVGMHLNEEDL